jgi:hypothetical protein
MDSAIQKLKKEGLISVWIFKENQKNYPGWNLACDQTGHAFLERLFGLINNSTWSAKKTFQIDHPTKNILDTVNNLNGKAVWFSPKNLTVHFKKGSSNLDDWKISLSNDMLDIVGGEKKILELQSALQKMRTGKEELAVSDPSDNHILYLWPVK